MSEDNVKKNSFANLLNNKKNNALQNKQKVLPKSNKGFASPSLVKRAGRGR
jgi:hypothetical protein